MRHKMTCSFFRHWPSLRLTQTELIIRNSAVRNEITWTWNWDSLPSCHNEADEISSVTAHGQSLHQKVLISRKRRRCYKPLTESGKCCLCKTCGTVSFPTTFSDLQGHSPKPFCYAIFFVYNNGTAVLLAKFWPTYGASRWPSAMTKLLVLLIAKCCEIVRYYASTRGLWSG